MADDFFFTGGAFEPDRPFGYYNFTEQNVATEIQPWWTSPRFKVRWFRPLSSLTLHLDFAVIGHPLLAHLHSVLWFVLLLLGSYRIFASVLSEKASRWAMALFSLSVIHAWGVGWIAARHALMGGTISVWAAYTYLLFRSRGRRRDAISSAVLFATGLLTSEVSLCLFGFVLSYELVASRHPFANRCKAAAPVVGISILYLIFYKCMDLGTDGSDLYNDPFSQPTAFLSQLGPKVLALMGAFMLGVPASVRVLPGMGAAALGAGAMGLLLLVLGLVLTWSRFDDDRKRTVKWLSLMGVLTMFPALAGIAQGREFMLSGIGILGVSAMILSTLFSIKAPWKRRLLPLAVGGLIFAGTLVMSPLSRVGMSYLIHIHAEVSRRIGGSDTECKKGSDVLVLTGNFDIPIIYAPHLVANQQGRFFRSWHQLAVSDDPVTLSRPTADRIVLTSKNRLVDPLLLREKEDPLEVGDVVERRRMQIEIMAVSDKGPTKVAFRFKSREAVDRICLLKTEKAVLKPIELPGVGQSTTVAYLPYME
jgi:hypothetical protein